MNSRIKKIGLLAGIFGPVFYFLILSFLGHLWTGYNPVTTGMSEIGAVDSPYKDYMNYLGFSLLGFLIIVFSFGFKALFKKNLQAGIAFILLLSGGISMFAVGFLPCDVQCIDVTWTGKMHSNASAASAILIPLAIMISAYPISQKMGEKWGYISFFLGLFSMSAGPVMFLEMSQNYMGLIQRLGIGLSLLWILIFSLRNQFANK